MMELTKDQVREILSYPPYLCEGYWRVQAIKAADEEFLPRLREVFADPEEGYQVQLAAAEALLRLGDSTSVERVAYDPQPRHPSVRVAAVRALGERYELIPDAVQRTLHEVWKEGDPWYRDDMKIRYLDTLVEILQRLQGFNSIFNTLLDLVDFQREHPPVLERVVELLLQTRGRDAAPVFARAFEEVRDTPYLALIYIRAIGEAGDPNYFDLIASYPDYVRQSAPHYYLDALAAVTGAAGRLGQYEWLREVGKRDLFSARTAWLRALGEVAWQQPEHREEIVAILRSYLIPRELGPTAPFKGSLGNLAPTSRVGHPPGARVEKPESDRVPCHNTALEVLQSLGEEMEV
jgi:hypothetical protein